MLIGLFFIALTAWTVFYAYSVDKLQAGLIGMTGGCVAFAVALVAYLCKHGLQKIPGEDEQAERVNAEASSAREIYFTEAEYEHHIKYRGSVRWTDAKGNTRVPTPVEVVKAGLESPEYLNKFKE